MDPLGFLKNTISHGLSDVEQWGSDAGNAVTHALGSVFGTNQAPQAPTSPQAAPTANPSAGLPINNPLALQNQQAPQQQAQQNPTLKMNFGQNQSQPQQSSPQAPQTLNTKLVNFNNPTGAPTGNPLANIKTNNMPGSFNATQQQPAQNNNPVSNFLNPIGALGAGIVKGTGKIAGIGVEDVRALTGLATGNQPAAQAAMQRGGQDINTLVQGVQSIPRAGIQIAKSFDPNQAPIVPNSPIAKLAVGKTPIPSLQQTFSEAGGGAKGLGTAVAAGTGDVLSLASLAAPISKGVGLLKSGDVAEPSTPVTDKVNSLPTDPDIAQATDNITKIANPTKTVPQSDEDSLNATEGRATATKEVDTLPSPYLLRKGIGVTPDMITQQDRDQASYSSATPEYIAGQRIVNMRNSDAERAAQSVLENGGNRDDAVKAYQDAHPGITKKDATFRVARMSRESNLALRPNARNDNPEIGQHDLPKAKVGDYDQAPINKGRVDATTDNLLKNANDSLSNLSQADRDNFEDYLEKTKPIEQADDAGKVQQAIQDSLKLTDTGNAFDHAVGGQTPHVENYFPGYIDRTDPDEIARNQLQAEQDLEEEVGPEKWNKMSAEQRQLEVTNRMGEQSQESPHGEDDNYGGYKNQKREFATRAERQAAGVKDAYPDPREALTRYANGLKFKVGGQAFKKAAGEADSENISNGIGGTIRYGRGEGDRVDLSDKGTKALKNSDINSGKGNVLTKVNQGVKKSLIALGVPHAVIIPPRFLGARLALETPDIGSLLKGGVDITKVDTSKTPPSDNVEFGTQIDSPLHSQRINAGVSLTSKLPTTRFVYNYLLPKMHDSLLSAARDYMDSRNIDYDSPQARAIGHQINDVMGYSKNGTGFFDQSTFAPSLIKSTANMYGKSLNPLNGTVARGGVIGQQLTNQALGFISKGISNQISQDQGKPQNKSKDDFWSTVVKEAISPSVYTPFRNSKGEQVDLGIPGQYQSDAAKVLVNLKRNSNGQLGVGLNSPAQALTNIAQTGKDIASPILSAGLSAVTNQTYSGQQVRNPNASPLTQLEQTVVNSGTNALPINVQTPANIGLTKILPKTFQQDIPQNQTGGPLLRSITQTFGMSPKADITTGQGPSITAYYNTKATMLKAVSGNPEATDAVNAYLDKDVNNKGQKVDHSPQESIGVANLVAGDPQALAALQSFEKSQPSHDPMWDLSPQDLRSFLSYQGTRATDSTKQAMPIAETGFNNGQGLSGFIQQRDAYYASQPNYKSTSVTNPQTPTYPNFTGAQGTDYQTYESTIKNGTSAEKSAFLNSHPDVVDAMSQLNQYYNNLGVAQGGLAIKNAPTLNSQQQAALNFYDSLAPSKSAGNTSSTSGERSAWIKANPNLWNQITQILAGDTEQSTAQLGAVEQYQGVPYTSKYLTGVKQLGSDIATVNGQSTLNPALAYTQSSSASGSKSGSSSNPLVPMPKVKHFKTPKMRKPPKLKGFRAPHIKKAQRVKIQSPGIQRTAVLKPTSVVKLAA